MLNEAKSRSAGKTVLNNIPKGISRFAYNVKRKEMLTLVFVAKDSAQTTIRVRLSGRGSTANIIGIVIGKDASAVKLHTMQIHAAPETTSNLLVKAVLNDTAKCLYDGGILVEKGAQKTDAYQRNENLLLSDKAYSESKPSLEILANDVRCTHGATAGPVSEEQLWYLATRGIDREKGERLIVHGFLKSALDRIDDEKIKNHLIRRFTDAV